MISLRPMAPAELEEMLGRLAPDPAKEHLRAGHGPARGSVERPRRELAQLLPAGVAIPDPRALVTEPAGERVGRSGTRAGAVSSSSSGSGSIPRAGTGVTRRPRCGRPDAEARRLGPARIGLHVFAEHTGARALYEREGFRPVGYLMARPVPA